MRLDTLIVTALELLTLLLVAGSAAVAATTYVGLWAGLLAAALVVGTGAYLADRPLRGDRGAAVRPSAPGR